MHTTHRTAGEGSEAAATVRSESRSSETSVLKYTLPMQVKYARSILVGHTRWNADETTLPRRYSLKCNRKEIIKHRVPSYEFREESL